MIEIKNLNKCFDEQVIFNNLSVSFKPHMINILTGPSGCGKTTLLRMISQLDTQYEGAIGHIPERISYVFQDDRLLPWYDVETNLRFVLHDCFDKQEVNDIIVHYLKAVQLYGHRHKRPSELSGGMLRRAALARAFVYPAPLLLMDEPFKGLDIDLKMELIDLFIKLQEEEEKTVLLVSHDPAVIDKLHGTQYVLKEHTIFKV